VAFPDPVVSERLLGRRPADRDLEAYVRFWTDGRVPEAVWPAGLRTSADARRVLQAGIAHWERWGFGPWTVLERETGTVVGRAGLAHTDVTGRPEVEAV
jgi:[ribosomal protein S5]-alanine N-acetyltransferase